MGFVIGAVVALVVIFLLAYITVKKPVFGEVMIVLSLLMVIVSTFFYFQKDNRVENKKNLIPVEQIELSDVSHHLAYGYYHKLTAHLSNLSQKYRLQSIIINIRFFQCPEKHDLTKDKAFDNCRLLTEKQHKIDTRLSPKQSSDIESYILLDDKVLITAYGSMPAKGSIQWQTKVVTGIAR